MKGSQSAWERLEKIVFGLADRAISALCKSEKFVAFAKKAGKAFMDLTESKK